MNAPKDSSHDPSIPNDSLDRLFASSGRQRLADNVEAIRDGYLALTKGSARRLADELKAVVAQLREPPEGVDHASLVLETDRLLAEIERRIAGGTVRGGRGKPSGT